MMFIVQFGFLLDFFVKQEKSHKQELPVRLCSAIRCKNQFRFLKDVTRVHPQTLEHHVLVVFSTNISEVLSKQNDDI